MNPFNLFGGEEPDEYENETREVFCPQCTFNGGLAEVVDETEHKETLRCTNCNYQSARYKSTLHKYYDDGAVAAAEWWFMGSGRYAVSFVGLAMGAVYLHNDLTMIGFVVLAAAIVLINPYIVPFVEPEQGDNQ